MNIDFDIISRLGVEYAVNLNHQLSENNARVFTDTTLTGIAEQDVRFQNTETYRYLEYEYDTNGNTTTASGVTQQITSGLILNLNGWISGDNMIKIIDYSELEKAFSTLRIKMTVSDFTYFCEFLFWKQWGRKIYDSTCHKRFFRRVLCGWEEIYGLCSTCI